MEAIRLSSLFFYTKKIIIMKKIWLLSLISLFAVASVSLNAQIKKAAIISVFGNKNLSDDPMDTKIYEALLKDSSFNITGTVSDFEKVIEGKLIPALGIPFMNKEEVVGNAEYQKVKSRLVRDDEEGKDFQNFYNPYVAAKGYKNIAAFGIVNDKKAIARCFEIFPDIDAVLIAYIDYNLVAEAGAMGITNNRVYANCNIKMFNKEEKVIFKLKEGAKSKSSVVGAAGLVTDPAKLKPMVFEASEQLIKDIEQKIPKSAAKMAKKLSKTK
jgi:hypothetical protein